MASAVGWEGLNEGFAGKARSGVPRVSACICSGLGMKVGPRGGEGGAVSGRFPYLSRLVVEGSLECVEDSATVDK